MKHLELRNWTQNLIRQDWFLRCEYKYINSNLENIRTCILTGKNNLCSQLRKLPFIRKPSKSMDNNLYSDFQLDLPWSILWRRTFERSWPQNQRNARPRGRSSTHRFFERKSRTGVLGFIQLSSIQYPQKNLSSLTPRWGRSRNHKDETGQNKQ